MVDSLDNHFVFLDLGARTPLFDEVEMENYATNRIALKCESVAISTAKNIMSFPTPAIGIATGESVSLGLDLGMSTKSISLSGIITEQTIYKQFSKSNIDLTTYPDYIPTTDSGQKLVKVVMTAQEVCQLIHSYVDASFLQSHQNLNRLIILYAGRVGPDYKYYHEAVGDGTESGDENAAVKTVENCPLIPFTYRVRNLSETTPQQRTILDAKGSIPIGSFPEPFDANDNKIDALSGFVRSFDTTFVGGQPYVEFGLSFEIALSSL